MTEGGFGPPTSSPAGWYPDPFDPSRQRYWDGREWDLSDVGSTGPAGVADDFPDVGAWLDRSFRLAYGRWRAVALIAVPTSLVSTMLGLLAVARMAEGLVLVDDEVEGWTNDRLPMVITYLSVALLLAAIGTLALTRLLLDSVDGETADGTGDEIASGARALVAALRVFPRALGWGLLVVGGFVLVALAGSAVGVAVPPVGVVLIVAAIPAVIWLATKWAFTMVAIVDRSGEPFSRSSRVSTGRWWPTLGRLVLLGIIIWLISLVLQTAATVLPGSDFADLGSNSAIQIDAESSEPVILDDEFDFTAGAIVVAGLASMMGTILTSSVLAAGTALLYRTRNPRG